MRLITLGISINSLDNILEFDIKIVFCLLLPSGIDKLPQEYFLKVTDMVVYFPV